MPETKVKIDKERTYYSRQMKGDRRQHQREVRFDYSDGYLGINQQIEGKVERVLLSPVQVKELIRFYGDPVSAS